MLCFINSSIPQPSQGSMAKDEDLKKVELKVSVDCCDGCKKKVLKALSIKGVLKTEIHPTLPKVTVVGNVDAQTLIKKLAKCGKMAEVLPAETKKQETGDKISAGANSATNIAKASGKNKPKEVNSENKPVPEQEKINFSNTDKTKQADSTEKNNCGKSGKDSKLTEGHGKTDGGNPNNEVVKPLNPSITTAATADATTALPQLNCFVNPGMVQAPQARIYYATEPNYIVPMTYYMPTSYPGSNMPTSYPAPNMASSYPAPPSCCMREHCYHDMSVHLPLPVQALPPQLTEYFNDENTVGCHVM